MPFLVGTQPHFCMPGKAVSVRASLVKRNTAKMTSRTAWKPHTKHGELTERSDLPDSVYAFPRQRKEPLTDAAHVKNALARFDQVQGVSDADRDQAFADIEKAAEYCRIEVEEEDWRELGKKPHTRNPTPG